MFFELRQYRMKPGQAENWVRMMEEKIIPFQVSKGMVIAATFVGEQDPDLYVWIRRFDSEEERARDVQRGLRIGALAGRDRAAYTGEMIDRTQTVVTRLVATSKSVIH